MKGKKAGRHVMLNPTAKEALREWLSKFAPLIGLLDPDSFVFQSKAGGIDR
jgi:hypothetical protein